MAISLTQVRSYEYLIAGNVGDFSYQRAIAQSPVDMVITGAGFGKLWLNRSISDPANSKLIIGYVNAGEAYASDDPNLFAGGTVPNWFGNPNPAYRGIYTVQFWNPAWEQQVLSKIGQLAAAGYDGVFLDLLSADTQWAAGNPENNPVVPGATAAMAKLVGDIRAYVDGLHLSHPFYLIGNQPTTIAVQSPQTISKLDGVFNEVLYWRASDTAGFAVSNVGDTVANFVSNTLTPVYTAAGVTVFGNDYPVPLTNLAEDFRSFEYYTSRGWVPSVQWISPSSGILATGPFMFMATPAAPVVQGAANAVDFISGGLTGAAILAGGNLGDFLIGGPGQNLIAGNAGDDLIYAHPASAGAKNLLQLQLIGNQVGAAPLPQVTVRINGQDAMAPATITSLWENGTTSQEVDLDLSRFGVIRSIEVVGVGLRYGDAANLNDLFLTGARYGGTPITLSNSDLNFTARVANNGNAILINQGGVVGLQLPAQALAPNTSDVIDGGPGVDTVVYRGTLDQYAVTPNSDGSLTVTAKVTAEGPDTLRNVEFLQFADQKLAVSAFGQAPAAAPAAPGGAPHAPGSLADTGIVGGYVNLLHDTAAQTLTGAADPGAVISIYDGAQALGLATADSAGQWSFVLGHLADGAHSLTASAANPAAAGPLSDPLRFTVDATPPIPVIGDVGFSSLTRLSTISGAAEPGSLVKVYDNGALLTTVSSDAGGAWSYSGRLAAGAHSFTETAIDAAGNPGASPGATLFSPSGRTALAGGAGDDVLIGAPGNTLTGGAGRDQFVMNLGFGQDVITDFDPRADVLVIDRRTFGSFSSLMQHASQQGTSTVITDDVGDTITLQNAPLASLVESDFAFF